MTEEELRFYYDYYLNDILKNYILNYGTVSFMRPDELTVKESKNRIPWAKKEDPFLIDSKDDHQLLAEDILWRGMYWPFFCIGNVVLLGHHRLIALQESGTDKRFMCVHLNMEHVPEGTLKYNRPAPLPREEIMCLPDGFKIPRDARGDEYACIKEQGYAPCIILSTYKDLMDALKAIPHFLAEELYQNPQIMPAPFINSEKEYITWLSATQKTYTEVI